jgi:hypothetical protein
MFTKMWKNEIKPFIISHYFSINIIFYHFLFANIPFKIGSMGSVFMINDDLNDKLFNLKKLEENKALFDCIVIIFQLISQQIFPIKTIVFWSFNFSIQLLFISIQFKLDRIVWNRPNITVTYKVLPWNALT